MNHSLAQLSVVFTVGAMLAIPVSLATAAEEPQVIRPTDIEDDNERDLSRFGEDVNTQGNLMVVAASVEHAAYVYELDGDEWRRVAKLTVEDADGIDFARNVALSTDYIAVSAPDSFVNGVPGAGAIFLYERSPDGSEWVYRDRLVATNPTTDAALGDDLVIDGDFVAATAPGADGTAYLFERDSESREWSEAFRSTGVATTRGDLAEVDVSGDTLAHLLSTSNVLLYEYDGTEWMLQRELELQSSFPTISLEDDVLAAGIPTGSSDDRQREEGITQLYERRESGWELVTFVHAEPPEPTYQFGHHVDLQDGVLAVSQRPENGTVFLFGQDPEGEWVYLGSPGGRYYRGVSFPISVSATTLAIGAPNSPASVFAYDITGMVPEDESGEDDGADTGDNTGDNTGDDTGNDDDPGDTGGGDPGTGDDDDPETVTGGDEGDDEGAGEDGDDESGNDEGDDESGGNDDDGDETGSGGETSEDAPPETDSGGGGALGWLLVLLLSGAGRFRRLPDNRAAR